MFLHLLLSPAAVPEGGAPADDPGLVPDGLRYVRAPEKAVVLHTLLPEVFTVVPLIEIEFHDILVISLK